jgi:Raf kinase inhibitor-like YbhB/YbcL family protein
MQLLSPDFNEGGYIPEKFTCEGENASPSLEINGTAPEGTTCYALVMEDPDAPMGTFSHWIFWNMPFATKEFSSGHMPESVVEGTNGAGKTGYIGPCPPSGTHRYFFKLYALDTSIELGQDAKVEELQAALNGHIVAETELVGMYAKKSE